MKSFIFLVSVTFCVSVLYASADAEMDSLLEMDFELLQNLEVVTATKTKISLKDVSSTMRIVTAKEIGKRGYITLKDALKDLPGFQFNDRSGFNTYMFMRGAPSK
ncbi:MAG: TonB-dependent receptor plug domain-containing protein [Campylobacterota bacterium]|nr:TonB-dependent receptor plug domain-containing protein [Campylobacterota bacterium]